jgi:DMSO/TMAO reductase YedYZ heme-binding membrane subunit
MSLSWVSARGAGIAAFSLLAAATIWGLLLSSKLLAGRYSTKNLTFVHEALSIGSLLATIIHVAAILTDQYVQFSIVNVLVPGSSSWRPSAVAFGIVALYGMLLTTSTFYMRRRIGKRTWRAIHYLTYGVFTSAVLHGIKAGTDSHGILAIALYGGAALVVAALTVIRVASYDRTSARRSPSGTQTRRHPQPGQRTQTARGIQSSHRTLGSESWSGSSPTASAATRRARSRDR